METVLVKKVELWQNNLTNDKEIYLSLVGFTLKNNEYIATCIPVKDKIQDIYTNIEINDCFLDRLKYKMRLTASINELKVNVELENKEINLSPDILEKYNKIFETLKSTEDIKNILSNCDYLSEEDKDRLLIIMIIGIENKLITPIENIFLNVFSMNAKILNIFKNNNEFFSTCQIIELNEENKLNYVRKEINITNEVNKAYEDSKVGIFLKKVVRIPNICQYVFTSYINIALKNKNVNFIYDETQESEYILDTYLIDIL